MALPINFILNFQVDSSKATRGINGISDSTQNLAKSFQQVSTNFNTWYGSSINVLNVTRKNLRSVGIELNKAFNAELVQDFGKRLQGVSREYMNMYKDKEFKRVEESFDSLIAATKKLAPYVNITDSSMQNLLESLTSIRTGAGGSEEIENLNKTMERLGKTFNGMKPKQTEAMTKLFEEFGKSETKSIKELEALEESIDAIVKKQEGIDELKNAFSDLFGFLPDGVSTLKQIARAAGAYTVFQDAAEAQEQMVTSLTQLGMVTQTGIRGGLQMTGMLTQWTDAVLSLGGATQISMKDATEAMAALANQRITTNISDMQELATTSVRMSQAFGMSTDQATEFIGALYKIGGLSKKDVAAAADQFANIQAQLGLTASEASGAASQVASMTRTMKVFGGRVKDVSAMVKGVAKLNVAFTKVGLSADEANQMLTSMLNPDDLEKNILLFQGLGMSAGDAIGMMTGETSQLANMDERMVKLAKSLKAQYGGNVFALKEMAQQYGMTLEQVQSLSQLSAKDLETKEKTANLEEQANKARLSMSAQLKKIWNQLNVILQSFVMPLLNVLTAIISSVTWLFNLIGNGIASLKKLDGFWGGFFKVVFDTLGFLTGGAVLAGLLGLSKGLFGLLNPLNLVKKGFGGIKDTLGGLMTKAKDTLKSLLKIEDAAPSEKVAKAAKPGASSPAESVTKSSEGFMKTLSGMKPQQLLAMGAAIFFIAAGVALIVISLVQLSKAMKDLNPEQLNALLGMTAIIMGGMILVILAFAVAVAALGAAGITAAPGILAIGAAIFFIAAGVAVVVLSIAYLVKTISESANGMAAFSLVVANLVPLLGGIALSITALGMAMIVLGSYAAVGGAGLLVFAGMTLVLALMIPVVSALGNAFNAMGTGIKNIADFGVTAAQNLIALRDTMTTFSSGFATNFIKEINGVADALARLTSDSMVMAATVKIMGTLATPQTASGEPGKAQTDAIAGLIVISNTYLSEIKSNTDTIVKILSNPKDKEERQKKNEPAALRFSLSKEHYA